MGISNNKVLDFQGNKYINLENWCKNGINKIDVISQYYDYETGYVVAILGLKDIQQYKSLYTLSSINGVRFSNRYIEFDFLVLIEYFQDSFYKYLLNVSTNL